MNWQFMIAGLTLGAISSLHCIGMCGPLALGLPVGHLPKAQKFLSILLYQFGRIGSYSLLGLFFGLIGRRFYMAGYQQWFSIILGAIILFVVIQHWILRKNIQPAFMNRFYSIIQNIMIRMMRRRTDVSFLFFGMANGFLPCGMVYMAIAGALVTSEITDSVLFMLMYGLGTLPAMMAIMYAGQFFSVPLRNSFRKMIPYIVSMIAVVLILRGMNLGIPYISPAFHPAQVTISCEK